LVTLYNKISLENITFNKFKTQLFNNGPLNNVNRTVDLIMYK